MRRPANRPRRIRRLAQLLGVGALCLLATGATAILLTVGRAGVDMSTLVTAPYSPDPTHGPLLVAPAPAPSPTVTRGARARQPRITSSGGDRTPGAVLAAPRRRTPVLGAPSSAGAARPGAAQPGVARPGATQPGTQNPPRTLITPDQGAPAVATGAPAPTGSKPALSKPTVSKPAVSKPAVSKPASSTPAARPGTPAKPKPSTNRPVVRPEPDAGVLSLVPGPRTRDIEPPEPGAEPAGPELRGVPSPQAR